MKKQNAQKQKEKEEYTRPEPTKKQEAPHTSAPGAQARHSSKWGPVAGILIVVVVLIIIGLYMWGAMAVQEAPADNEAAHAQEEEQAALPPTSASDEAGAIENDLANTDLDAFEAELNALEAELDALMQ